MDELTVCTLVQYVRHFHCIFSMCDRHRRGIDTEEKAMVVAAVWGTEWIKFLAALDILHPDDLKKRMNSSYSSYHPGATHPILHIVQVQNS